MFKHIVPSIFLALVEGTVTPVLFWNSVSYITGVTLYIDISPYILHQIYILANSTEYVFNFDYCIKRIQALILKIVIVGCTRT